MNSSKENNHKKALASAALAHGITPQRFAKDAYFPIDRYGERVAGTRCYDYWTTPDAALAAAAEALGLEPDPILQQTAALHYAQYAHLERAVTNALAELDKHGQPHAVGCDLATAWGMLKGVLQQWEHTPASPPVHLTVKGQHGDTVTVHITEAEHGLRLQATGDGESAVECVSVTGDVQWTSALTEAQKETLLIVAEVTGDLIIHAEAVESGACSRPDATELLAWAEELQQPARLLETLFDLAPKESAPDTISRLPTPADLHRTIGQARGLIQTAIGQMRDLGVPHVSKHLCSARRYLDGGKAHIESALLAVIPDPQEGGKPDA